MSHVATVDEGERDLDKISDVFFARPKLLTLVLLLPPLLWIGIVYVGSLFALLLQSFYSLDDYSGLIVHEFTLSTYAQLLEEANLQIIIRTVSMAALVTLACAVIAFPIAYYAARYARGWTKALFYLAVMMPLWSSYLVKVYAWKLILAKEGILTWLAKGLHLSWLLDGILALPVIGGPSLSFSYIGTFLVFVYIWMPYMILPTQAALERVPVNYIEASADLGAEPRQTFWTVIFPLALPGIIAGSIFTFSLTLGDYIVPTIVGNSRLMIGQAVYTLQGTAGQHSARRRLHRGADGDHGRLSLGGQTHGGVRCPLIQSARTPLGLRIAAIAGLSVPASAAGPDLALCLHHGGEELPVPAAGLHHEMVRRRLVDRPDIWPPLYLSLEVAAIATVLALMFGTLAAAALSRAKFFGRETISLLFVLPIALPGIITGISLRSAFDIMDIPFSIWTIVLGHATFCIVVVYNNAVARFRRLSGNLDRGLDGSRRRRLPDLPPRDPAANRHRAARRRHARLRAVLRRGDRHHLHGWPAVDPADLDAGGADPAAPAPGHQCRRGVRHRRHAAADPRRLLSDARGRAHGRSSK